MKNKILIFGFCLLFLATLSVGDLVVPTSIFHHQNYNTTIIYDFNITNTANNSESVNIQLTGGEILDLTNDFPKDINIPANSSRTIFYTINTEGKTAKNLSGTLIFYYSSQKNIPFNVEILGPEFQPSPEPEKNKTLQFSLNNPPLKPGKTALFQVTDSEGYAISTGTIIIAWGGQGYKEASISNGFSFASIPQEAQCPMVVSVSSSGYKMTSKAYSSSSECISEKKETTPFTGDLKFIPAGISTSVQQFITSQVGYWLKNSMENCEIQITGGEFTSGTTVTQEGRKPVRIGNLPHESISPGGKILVTFTIDTTGFGPDGKPLVSVGSYEPVYTVYAEDCQGNDLSSVFRFNLNVIKGISPQQNETKKEEMIDLIVDYKPGLGNEVNIYVKDADTGDALKDAKIEIYYPNADKNTYWTSSEGKFKFVITQIGDYFIRASKDGYKDEEYNFTIGTRTITISTNSPYLTETLKITVTSDNKSLQGADVRITTPSNERKIFTTSSQGEVTYVVNETGDYEIFVSKSGYSSQTKTITVSARELTLETNDVSLGGTLIVTVKSGNTLIKDATVIITDPNGNESEYTTDSAGEVTVTLDKEGKYSIVAKKEGFSSDSKEINLKAKQLSLIYEGNMIQGGNIIIYTKSDNQEVGGVNVEITYPNNEIETFTSSPSGKISLNLGQDGKYSLTATKSGYSKFEDSFDVKKKQMSLSMTYYDEANNKVNSPVYGGKMELEVLDENGDPLTGVDLTITTPLGEKTNSRSIDLFTGTYTIKATKTGYADLTKTITVQKPFRCSIITPKIFAGQPFRISCTRQGSVSINCGKYKDTKSVGPDGKLDYTISSPAICYLEYDGMKGPVFEVKKASNVWDWVKWFLIIIVISLISYGIYKKKPKKIGKKKKEETEAEEIEKYL